MDYADVSDEDFLRLPNSWYTFALLPASSKLNPTEILILWRHRDEQRKYHPLDYLNYGLSRYEERIYKCINFHKKCEIAIEAKTFVNDQIETFNGMLFDAPEPVIHYNFNSVSNKANNLATEWKDKLENKRAKREWSRFWIGLLAGALISGLSALLEYYLQCM